MKCKDLLFILAVSSVDGAFDLFPVNRSGQGDGMWLSFSNPFPSFVYDPASLENISGNSLMTTRWHPWQIREITAVHNWLVLKHNRFRSGAGYFRIENKIYRESILFVSGAWRPARDFTVGLTVHRYGIRIRDYGQANTTGYTISAHHSFNRYISWGIVLSNPTPVSIGSSDEQLPRGIVSALAFDAGKAGLQIEWTHGNFMNNGINTGVWFRPHRTSVFSLTSGNDRGILKYGVEINTRGFHISYGGKYSVQMQRITHQVAIGLTVRKRIMDHGRRTGSGR